LPNRARGRRQVAGGAGGTDRQTRLAAAVAAAVTTYLEAEAEAVAVQGPPAAWPAGPAGPTGWVMAGRMQALLQGQSINPRKGPHPR
jgi:hypothetical protein